MRSTHPIRSVLRLLFICGVVLSLPILAYRLLAEGPFEGLRRQVSGAVLTAALGTPIEVKGPVEIAFGLEPVVSIRGIASADGGNATDVKALAVDAVDFQVPLLPLLIGRVDMDWLTVEGLKVVIELPQGRERESKGAEAIAAFVSGVVHSPVSRNFELRDAAIDYSDRETGFSLRYGIDAIVSKAREDGAVDVDARGDLNGEPWAVSGNAKPLEDGNKRQFAFSATHAGLTSALAGDFVFGWSGDTVDMRVTSQLPSLQRFLAVYQIAGGLEGSADISGRLSGPLETLKLSDLMVKLAVRSGAVFTVSGVIDDVVAGKGLALTLGGRFAEPEPASAKAWPLLDIGITGFSGRIEGNYDGVLVRDFVVHTDALNTVLSEFGPITAERLYKDENGRLGLYDIVALAGPADRPSVRIAGTVKDIIDFHGVDLKGKLDLPVADVLDLAAGDHADDFGHLVGGVVVSDADGSLGVDTLSLTLPDSDLMTMSVELVFDDMEEANAFRFATHLDIPRFEAVAAALGSEVEGIGAVKFDGTATGSGQRVEIAGTAVTGQTTFTGTLTGTMAENKPVLSGDLSSPLLHLSDMRKLQAISATYLDHVNEQDEDVVDPSKAWESLLVDLQINVDSIAGGGPDASNIKGRVTFRDGVAGLDSIAMAFLGGRTTTSGEIDTRSSPKRFALQGRVSNLPIGRVLDEMEVTLPVRGTLSGTYDITGSGNDAAAIPRTLNGSVNMSLRNGWIGSDMINLTGMSPPAWLLSRGRAGSGTDIVCVEAPFAFNNGQATTRGLVLETSAVQIVGVGYVDLRRDAIDLRFKPQALRRELINTAQPFAVQGPLDSPALRLKGAPVANALAGTIAFPFNVLDGIVQPRADAPGRVPCQVTRATDRRQRGTEQAPRRRGLGIFGNR